MVLRRPAFVSKHILIQRRLVVPRRQPHGLIIVVNGYVTSNHPDSCRGFTDDRNVGAPCENTEG